MADINKSINIDVNTNGAEEALNRIGNGLDNMKTGQTKIIQSTRTLSKETTTLNDGLLKNGGAMGLLSAATGGLAMDFKDAVEAIELTGVSLKGLRGAIIATGIGALAILVLELVTNWDKWVGVIDGSTAALERLNSQQEAFNRNQQVTQVNQAEEIINLQEKIRLREAEGASTQEIIDLQNELAEATKRSADLALFGIEGQRKGLFDLRAEYASVLETLDEGTDKYNETYQKYIDNEKAINEQLKIRAAAINDPKVRAAQEDNLRIERLRTKELEAQKKLQDAINASIQRGEQAGKTLADINNALIGLTLNDLTPVYYKFKNLTDAYYTTRDAAKALITEINFLAGKDLNDAQKKRLDELIKAYKPYESIIKEVSKNIKRLKEQNPDAREDTWDLDPNIVLAEMTASYDILYKSMMNFEKADFGVYQNRYADIIERTNKLLDQNILITQKKYEIDNTARKDRLQSLVTEQQSLKEQQFQLGNIELGGEKVSDVVKRLQETDLQDGSVLSIYGKEMEEMAKRYFDLEDKIRDFSTQIRQLKKDQAKSDSDSEIELNNLRLVAIIEQEKLAVDAKLEAQQEYFDKVQILTANSFSFMDQLQNEAIIKSKDLRNVLLVAQKGAEIAQVVIGTTRENAKLKQRAGDYSSQATLYKALAASLAATDPIAAASYASAGTSYAAGAAKSLAQIPYNWGIAGTSIASILATTLTSWNRSDGGGGGNAGAGGGASAQFNIVGASGTNQLAAQIAAQQQQPINAYVVGSDVSTQQSLDRNRITNATFL